MIERKEDYKMKVRQDAWTHEYQDDSDICEDN